MYHVNVDQLARLYAPQTGRGANELAFYKSDYRRQRGNGLGSIFGAIARKLIPFAKSVLWPAAKKHILPHAISAATNLGEDILSGENVLKSVKKRGSTALREVGASAIKGMRDQFSGQSQTGSGRRRKRKATRKLKRPAAKKRKVTKRKAVRRKPRRKTQRKLHLF